MSLVLVAIGAALFLGGLGSREWVQDDKFNYTVNFGLWETCRHGGASSGLCSAIHPASAAAYFEATCTAECLALVVYAVTLCTCFLADDRPPAQSCAVCVRRYIHVLATFTAGGYLWADVSGHLDIRHMLQGRRLVRGSHLGYFYWLSLAGSLVTTAGGVMRAVFITWPDRPALPLVQSAKLAPQAPARRTARPRTDDVLGADPLPFPLRPEKEEHAGSADKKKHGSRFRRFLGFFQRRKAKKAVAGISTLSEAVRQTQDQDQDQDQDRTAAPVFQTENKGAAQAVHLRSAIKPPNTKPRDDDSDDDDETFHEGVAHRRGPRRPRNGRLSTKNRVQIVEPFVGSSSDSNDSIDGRVGRGSVDGKGHHHRVKRYQRVVKKEDLRARVLKTPPSVVYPPARDTGTRGSTSP
ncbi:hypothetical protein ACOMHN_064754 [Nucella lapillus]